MRQFNLEEYLSNPSKKIVTRDGRSVRVICTNRRDYTCPIVALVEEENNKDTVCTFRKDGNWSISDKENELDLFFAPEKYEGWTNVYVDDNFRLERTFIYKSEEEARAVGVRRKGYVATVKIEWEE